MWYKKGGELPAGKTKLENFNKALRISNVSEEDSGEYFCLASNKMGSIRHTISVRVKGTSPLPCHLLPSHSQKLRGASVVWGLPMWAVLHPAPPASPPTRPIGSGSRGLRSPVAFVRSRRNGLGWNLWGPSGPVCYVCNRYVCVF